MRLAPNPFPQGSDVFKCYLRVLFKFLEHCHFNNNGHLYLVTVAQIDTNVNGSLDEYTRNWLETCESLRVPDGSGSDTVNSIVGARSSKRYLLRPDAALFQSWTFIFVVPKHQSRMQRFFMECFQIAVLR